jgi:hypothetical protein
MEILEVIVNRALEWHTLLGQLGLFRGISLALFISILFWLVLGLLLTLIWNG